MQLPDVNVLIALFDPKHLHHEPAQAWFATVTVSGWATCPLTENGFLRVVSNPNYPDLRLSLSDVAAGLRQLIATYSECHEFWADDLSLCDTSLFQLSVLRGHRQLTDLYLLGLCQRHNATLVTFDGGIQDSTHAIVDARSNLIHLLHL